MNFWLRLSGIADNADSSMESAQRHREITGNMLKKLGISTQ
jgi:hypothetical protein